VPGMTLMNWLGLIQLMLCQKQSSWRVVMAQWYFIITVNCCTIDVNVVI